jgi:flagellin
VAGFKSLSDSLSLGESTLGVAANAAEAIGSLLEEIKGKIVSANEDNVDRAKLQDEVVSLRNQISGIVSSAQFNGLNLIDGSEDGVGGFSVLASLDRGSDGTVTTSNVSFDPTNTNLSTSSGTDLIAGTNPATTVTVGSAAFATPDVGIGSADVPATASAFGLAANSGGAAGATFNFGDFLNLQADGTLAAAGVGALAPQDVNLAAGTAGNGLVAGDKVRIVVGNSAATYTVAVGDTSNDVVSGLRSSLIESGIDQDTFSLSTTANAGELTIVNQSEQSVNGYFQITRASGGLAGLDTIDVSTAAGARAALGDIENFIQSAVDAQAQLGTTQKRLEIQNEFMSSLIDSFKTGIGSLVDANMEAASARLQALQVQQQLATQSLSIANQAPQNILSLFR